MSQLPFSQKDMDELRRIANTDAGRQLVKYLQKHQGSALKSAVREASAGNYSEAKELAKSLLSSPEARELLRQLGK